MRTLIAIALVALSACATPPTPLLGPPTFDIAPGLPAPRGRFYGDCITQSTTAHTFDRENGLIRFHCTGAPAQAFFDALASYSASVGSEYHASGLTWRVTSKLERNPDGLDFCTHADAGGAYGCTLIFNAGAFVSQ